MLCASIHAGITTSDSCTKRLAWAGYGSLLLVRSPGGGEEEEGEAHGFDYELEYYYCMYNIQYDTYTY